jgi:type IV pilus assembly protein PilX
MLTTSRYRARHERGAALIVALLLLLVMTILGVTALNSSTLQGLISSAYRQQTSTLAGAENLLLAGEMDVEEIVTDATIDLGALGYYFDLPAGDTQFEATTSTPSEWDIGPLIEQAIGEMDISGRYVIEYMGDFEVPGESIAEGGGLEDSLIHIFRVSARGGEANRGAVRTVQSFYVTLRAPGGE